MTPYPDEGAVPPEWDWGPPPDEFIVEPSFDGTDAGLNELDLPPELPEEIQLAIDGLKLQFDLVFNSGRFEEALPLAQQRVMFCEDRLVDPHPEQSVAYRDLADTYRKLNLVPEALTNYQLALCYCQTSLPETDPIIISSLCNQIGELHLANQSPLLAEEAFSHSIDAYRNGSGYSAYGEIVLLRQLRDLQVQIAEPDKAHASNQRIVDLIPEVTPADYLSACVLFLESANVFLDLKRPALAEQSLEVALFFQKQSPTTPHTIMARLHITSAHLHFFQHQHEEATDELRSAISCVDTAILEAKASESCNHERVLELYSFKADILKAAKRPYSVHQAKKDMLEWAFKIHGDSIESLPYLIHVLESSTELYINADALVHLAKAEEIIEAVDIDEGADEHRAKCERLYHLKATIFARYGRTLEAVEAAFEARALAQLSAEPETVKHDLLLAKIFEIAYDFPNARRCLECAQRGIEASFYTHPQTPEFYLVRARTTYRSGLYAEIDPDAEKAIKSLTETAQEESLFGACLKLRVATLYYERYKMLDDGDDFGKSTVLMIEAHETFDRLGYDQHPLNLEALAKLVELTKEVEDDARHSLYLMKLQAASFN